jgi:hypothetical protein
LATGSVSAFDANANSFSPAPDGYTTGGVRRVQGTVVDDDDNVWTCNNWKPDFDNDTAAGNPGGDGMLIWVGLAKPRS